MSRGSRRASTPIFGLQPPIDDWLQEEEVDQQIIIERLQALADEAMATKTSGLEPGALDRGRAAASCSRRSIVTGRSICRRSTRCAR